MLRHGQTQLFVYVSGVGRVINVKLVGYFVTNRWISFAVSQLSGLFAKVGLATPVKNAAYAIQNSPFLTAILNSSNGNLF